MRSQSPSRVASTVLVVLLPFTALLATCRVPDPKGPPPALVSRAGVVEQLTDSRLVLRERRGTQTELSVGAATTVFASGRMARISELPVGVPVQVTFEAGKTPFAYWIEVDPSVAASAPTCAEAPGTNRSSP